MISDDPRPRWSQLILTHPIWGLSLESLKWCIFGGGFPKHGNAKLRKIRNEICSLDPECVWKQWPTKTGWLSLFSSFNIIKMMHFRRWISTQSRKASSVQQSHSHARRPQRPRSTRYIQIVWCYMALGAHIQKGANLSWPLISKCSELVGPSKTKWEQKPLKNDDSR